MATIEERLAEVEAAGYDYRITRATRENRVYLGVDICFRGALDSISSKLHSYADAASPADLAEAIASALAQQRELSRRLAVESIEGSDA